MSNTNRQRLVTVVGTNYADTLVPELIEQSLDVYNKKDFSQRNFQVSVTENTNATAGIVLTVLGIEAYRNRIYYLERKQVSSSVTNDLTTIFLVKDASFPKILFSDLLNEVFLVRDVIVHNHIYEVTVINDQDWKMLNHRQKLLKGYGDNRRLRSGLVIERTRKTRNLGLNVQPAKIGFEDIYIIYLVFGLFVEISNRLLSRSHVPFSVHHKHEGDWYLEIDKYFKHVQEMVSNQNFLAKIKVLETKIQGMGLTP